MPPIIHHLDFRCRSRDVYLDRPSYAYDTRTRSFPKLLPACGVRRGYRDIKLQAVHGLDKLWARSNGNTS